jgi:hypothetical protein
MGRRKAEIGSCFRFQSLTFAAAACTGSCTVVPLLISSSLGKATKLKRKGLRELLELVYINLPLHSTFVFETFLSF